MIIAGFRFRTYRINKYNTHTHEHFMVSIQFRGSKVLRFLRCAIIDTFVAAQWKSGDVVCRLIRLDESHEIVGIGAFCLELSFDLPTARCT